MGIRLIRWGWVDYGISSPRKGFEKKNSKSITFLSNGGGFAFCFGTHDTGMPAADAEPDEVGDDTATVPTRQLFISCGRIPLISVLSPSRVFRLIRSFWVVADSCRGFKQYSSRVGRTTFFLGGGVVFGSGIASMVFLCGFCFFLSCGLNLDLTLPAWKLLPNRRPARELRYSVFLFGFQLQFFEIRNTKNGQDHILWNRQGIRTPQISSMIGCRGSIPTAAPSTGDAMPRGPMPARCAHPIPQTRGHTGYLTFARLLPKWPDVAQWRTFRLFRRVVSKWCPSHRVQRP